MFFPNMQILSPGPFLLPRGRHSLTQIYLINQQITHNPHPLHLWYGNICFSCCTVPGVFLLSSGFTDGSVIAFVRLCYQNTQSVRAWFMSSPSPSHPSPTFAQQALNASCWEMLRSHRGLPCFLLTDLSPEGWRVTFPPRLTYYIMLNIYLNHIQTGVLEAAAAAAAQQQGHTLLFVF